MAAIPVTITGVLADKFGRTLQNVTLFGELSYTGLGVGGGPIEPPAGSGGVPTHPIMLPGMPGWGDPHPEHPIVLPPDKPTEPPADNVGKPPPPEGGWGWHPSFGWGYFPGTGPVPGPKTS